MSLRETLVETLRNVPASELVNTPFRTPSSNPARTRPDYPGNIQDSLENLWATVTNTSDTDLPRLTHHLNVRLQQALARAERDRQAVIDMADYEPDTFEPDEEF